MTDPEIDNLFKRYEQGICTPEEEKLIEKWLDSPSNAGNPFKNKAHELKVKAAIKKAIYNRVALSGPDSHRDEGTSIEAPTRTARAVYLYSTLKIAAAITLLAVASFGIYTYLQDLPAEALAEAGIKPGGDKAILTLADGSQVELNTIQTSIPQQGVAQITSSNGQLAYVAAIASAKAAEPLYNIVSTPRGGQYQVTLSDGSKVWLNAASSLKFPAAFSGNERVVELTGEAYFEIAKNEKMPFKVMTPDGSEVKVLGTHFNVMAYAEEGVTKTTLLEGSVQVTASAPSLKERVGVRLVPGQRSVINNSTGTLNIEPANLKEAVAWKNGDFLFNNTRLETIMNQVARWYDVDVTYQDDMREVQFIGEVSRTENVSSVLDLMKLTGSVDFKIEGKRIIVKNAKQ